jgi:succinyl-CoA synthetase beta subunit
MPVLMASEAGGMEIEEVAAQAPEKILRSWVDPAIGFHPFHGRRLAFGLNLAQEQIRPATEIASALYRLFRDKDCSLAEINPLAVTSEGALVAVDAKLNFDDNALYRHPDIQELRDRAQEDPLEVEALSQGVSNYIRLEGNIGCLVNGAGLAMATMDVIKAAGGEPANFLDIGGGAREERVVNAFRILTSDPNIKAILLNIFGGIARVDIIARGVVAAAQQMEFGVPVVVRLAGTNVEEGRRILDESGVRIIEAVDLKDAAEKAVKAASGG